MANWRSVILPAAAILCIGGLAWGVHRLQQIDPFARFNPLYAQAGMGDTLVRFTNVEVVARQLRQPLWRMRVQQANLARDRQRWQLQGIQEAVLYNDGNPFWKLRARYATYEGASRYLQVFNAALTSQQAQLQCALVTWHDHTRELRCLGDISGRLRDGEFTARSLQYLAAQQRLIAEEVRLQIQTRIQLTTGLQTPNPTPNNQIPRTRRVQIEFRRLEEQQGKTRIGEGLTIRDGDTLITADRAEQDIEAQVIRATGNLRVSDPRVEITAQRLTIQLKEKRALLEGNVQITVKPKEEDQQPPTEEERRSLRTEMRQPVRITCDRAENLYQKKVITLTGNLKMIQILQESGKTRTLTAQKAVYNSRTEQVQLLGDVHGVDEKGQELRAPEILVSVKEGDEWLRIDQPGRLVILVEEEEETPTENPSPPPSP